MTFEGLLPEDFEEFRSVKFWDGFFQKRKQKAFEWYGDWRQLQPLVWDACAQPNKKILMLGCGNSDLSAHMYDSGCRNITNIDFSKICIKEMMMKNLRQRPAMKWMVMDMTQTTFAPASFQVAFDKGALDALMGEDTEAAGEAGSKLLSEVQRVLTEQGQYICVTLAQPHVLKTLLASFGAGWGISIDRVAPSPDMARSPLQPFVVRVNRQPAVSSNSLQHADKHLGQNDVDGQIDDLDAIDTDETNQAVGQGQSSTDVQAAAVALTFKPDPGAVNAEQIADVVQIVKQENTLRAAGGRHSKPLQPPTPTLPPSQPPSLAPSIPSFDKLAPGRRCVVALPTCMQQGDHQADEKARFNAAVLDVDTGTARRAVRDCAVFLVPQGREHEWLFASPEGQAQVAQGCAARRVVIVSFSRQHQYGSLKAVQAELSPMVSQLAPLAARDMEGAIPFMTTQEGIGSRVVLEEAASALTGGISVEDVTLQEPGEPDTVVRRMVFTSNRNLVQSEAALIPAETAVTDATPDAGRSAAAGKKAKSKKRQAKSEDTANGAFKSEELVVDHSVLACDYHKGIIAGLTLIQPHLTSAQQSVLPPSLGGLRHQHQQQQDQQQSREQWQQAEWQQAGQQQDSGNAVSILPQYRGQPQVMLVGLGGGGLPVYLNQFCGMNVSVVELDPTVVDLARRHFGFRDSSSLQATVGDGLEAVAQLACRLTPDASAAAAAGLQPSTPRQQDAAVTSTSAQGEAARCDTAPLAANTAATPPDNAQQQQQQQQECHDPEQAQQQQERDLKQQPQEQLDVLIIDAGSGDASQPMSCPPPAFLEPAFLQHAKQVLQPEGMLVVNCVSRAIEPYKAAVKALQAVFAEVYELDVDEDVNRVLFAVSVPVRLSATQSQQQQGKGKKHTKQAAKAKKEVQIDGTADAVKLLRPRLAQLVNGKAQQRMALLENMLQNLCLVK